eukprot:TRINITY_DN4589_c0_g1_i1.p1 TRINITY_DN4589_c0_g1~~TRINITY_DN4589_c0_g1_i1.p1  ORF type:complete len:1008 (-),score=204.55 TRINITY_DN4589_c0_g1_i1:36-3059(-)
MRFQARIWVKLLVFVFFLLAISMTVLGVVIWSFTSDQITKQIQRQTFTVATLKRSQLRLYINDELSRGQLTANRVQLQQIMARVSFPDEYGRNSSDDYDRAYDDLVTGIQPLSEIFVAHLLDINGNTFVLTNSSVVLPPEYDIQLPADDDEREFTLSHFVFVDGILYFQINAVILFQGRRVGTLCMVASGMRMLTMTNDTTGLGDSGSVVVGVAAGAGLNTFQFVVPPVKSPNLYGTVQRWDAMGHALEGVTSTETNSVNYLGDTVLVTYMPLGYAGWGLAVMVTQSEALEPLVTLGHIIAGVLVGFVFVGLIISYFFSRAFTAPIMALHVATISLAVGDLSAVHKLTADSGSRWFSTLRRILRDEVYELMESFSGMAMLLNNQQLGLEQAVRDRTQELENEKELVKEASRAKSDFMANMSHEVRTPLHGITGITELCLSASVSERDLLCAVLKDSSRTSTPGSIALTVGEGTRIVNMLEEQVRLLSMLQSSADNLLQLINDILDLNKIDAGKLVLANSPFQIRNVINQVCSAIQPRADVKSLSLACTVADTVPDIPLLGDKHRLAQVLFNLIDNAIKFTLKGGVSVEAVLYIAKSNTPSDGEKTGSHSIDMPVHPLTDASTLPKSSGTSSTHSEYEGMTRLSTLSYSYNPAHPPSNDSRSLPSAHSGPRNAGSSISSTQGQHRPPVPTITILFNIHDTGIGIPTEKHAILFQPFTQVDDSYTKRFGGTGIGLAICKRLVELLGGRIWLESAPNEGSTFSFTASFQLATQIRPIIPGTHTPDTTSPPTPSPVDPTTPQPRETNKTDTSTSTPTQTTPTSTSTTAPTTTSTSTPTEPEKRPPAQTVPKLHILVVEDNTVNQQVMIRMLKRLSLTSQVVSNGLLAVEEFERNGSAYDVILMDVQMPIMDGIQATIRIRQMETEQMDQGSNEANDSTFTPVSPSASVSAHVSGSASSTFRSGRSRIPIVALTAHATPMDQDRCREAGMTDFATKPIDIAKLRNIFNNLEL